MCGISAIIHPIETHRVRETLELMNAAMAHRGPDAWECGSACGCPERRGPE